MQTVAPANALTLSFHRKMIMTNVFSFVKNQYKTLAEEVNAEAEYGGLSQPSKRYLLPIAKSTDIIVSNYLRTQIHQQKSHFMSKVRVFQRNVVVESEYQIHKISPEN